MGYSATEEGCCSECDSMLNCGGYVFYAQQCYLKSDIFGTFSNFGRVTRVKGSSPSPSQCFDYGQPQENTDLSGTLLKQVYSATEEGCCSECDSLLNCGGYAFYAQQCYLKRDISGTYSNPGRVTRVKGFSPSPSQCFDYGQPQE